MPNRTRAARVTLAALALSALGACASVPRPASPSAVVVFTNESVDLAELYAVRGGSSIRLGRAEAGRTVELSVPATALGAGGTVSFIARIFGRPRLAPTSGDVSLLEGERVAVRLPFDLAMLAVVPARP